MFQAVKNFFIGDFTSKRPDTIFKK